MALPDFNETGDLPPGVHVASLTETVRRFGAGTERRKLISTRLERIYQVASQTSHLHRFVVFGSFITDESQPNDVDVFMIMDDNFDMGRLGTEAQLLFNHGTAQDHFGASVFWVRRMAAFGGEQVAIEDWQIKRDGTQRGIVEITVT